MVGVPIRRLIGVYWVKRKALADTRAVENTSCFAMQSSHPITSYRW